MSKHLKYRAHVDGLRAVAILPVIFFHAGLGFTGGYVGVDVFFVISGFLISGLIFKDIDAGGFHITEFWERRVRRILPALAVVVLACLVAAWFLFFPQDFTSFGHSVVAQALLVSNFFFYNDASYFAQGVDLKPLLHTWSLAVEEQFYLVFPFILMAFKRFERKSPRPGIVVLGVASFLLSVYCSYKHQRANFYLLPTRSWELLVGSYLAASPVKKISARWAVELLSGAGLLVILAAVFCYDNHTRFPGASALLPCIGSGLIIWAGDRGTTLVSRFLASRPMVFIGLISYSLYLWHWPVLVFFKYWNLTAPTMGQGLLLLLLSFLLAVLSWRFIETPFRKRVVAKNRSQVFAFGGVTTMVLLLAGLGVYRWHGMPSRIPTAALQYLDGTIADAGSGPVSDRELSLTDVQKGDFNELGKGDKSLPVSLLVWGDSHAKVVIPVLDSLCQEHSGRGVVATHPQTAPLVGYDSEGEWSLKADSIPYNNAVLKFMQDQHVRNVLLVARWDYYIDADKGTDKLRKGLLDTIDALQSSGAKIWILKQPPHYPWSVPKALASAVLHGHDPGILGMPAAEYRVQSQQQDPIFDGLTAKFSNVRVLDPTELFVDPVGRCRLAASGKALYYDADHVSVAGAMLLRPLFEPIFNDGKSQSLVGSAKEK